MFIRDESPNQPRDSHTRTRKFVVSHDKSLEKVMSKASVKEPLIDSEGNVIPCLEFDERCSACRAKLIYSEVSDQLTTPYRASRSADRMASAI